MEPEGSLPNSQMPPICLYPEPDQSSPYLSIPRLEDLFNIILPSMLRSSKWPIFLSSFHQNPVCKFCPPIRTTRPAHLIILNLLKPKTYFMYHQLWHPEILCSAHSAFMCFVCISEQTAIISLYRTELSVFKTEAENVYCAVRTGSLNQTDRVSYLKG